MLFPINRAKVLALITCSGLGALPAQAQFNPGPNPINSAVDGEQTLSSGTGTITSSGSATLSANGSELLITLGGNGTILDNDGSILRSSGDGDSAGVFIDATASGVSLDNAGDIQNTGGGRAIWNDDPTAGKVTLINSGLIQSADADAVKFKDTELEIQNSGSIIATGGQALDLIDITSKALSINNMLGGTIQATDSDALRAGANAVITNAGTIRGIPVAGSGSDGIQGDTNTGIHITNSGTVRGRHGITGGIDDTSPDTYTITVINQAGGNLRADNGSGVNIDGLTTNATATVENAQGGTILGTVDATSTNGDGDGVDVDGVVNLTNHGDVLGYGAKGNDSGGRPNNAEAVAAGGGTITNGVTGQIIGSTLASDAPNGDPTRQGRGILIDDGANGSGVAATTVDNAGLIWGKTGFAAKMVGDFNDEITNQAGATIRGANGSATVQMGDGNDQLTNAGTVTNDGGSTATAIAMEDGNDTVTISGGNASVQGGMDGGAGSDTLDFNVGAGSFSTDGEITNFETINVNSGTASLGGAVTGDAVTVNNSATLLINDNLAANTVEVKSGGTLGGDGSFSAPVTIENGGTLAPGNSPGSLEFFDGLQLDAGSLITMEIGSLASDSLVIDGLFNVLGGQITLVDAGLNEIGDFVLFDYSGGSLGGDFANLSVVSMPSGWEANLLDDSGNSQVVVQVTAIPEPAGGALLLATGLMAALTRRRMKCR